MIPSSCRNFTNHMKFRASQEQSVKSQEISEKLHLTRDNQIIDGNVHRAGFHEACNNMKNDAWAIEIAIGYDLFSSSRQWMISKQFSGLMAEHSIFSSKPCLELDRLIPKYRELHNAPILSNGLLDTQKVKRIRAGWPWWFQCTCLHCHPAYEAVSTLDFILLCNIRFCNHVGGLERYEALHTSSISMIRIFFP